MYHHCLAYYNCQLVLSLRKQEQYHTQVAKRTTVAQTKQLEDNKHILSLLYLNTWWWNHPSYSTIQPVINCWSVEQPPIEVDKPNTTSCSNNWTQSIVSQKSTQSALMAIAHTGLAQPLCCSLHYTGTPSLFTDCTLSRHHTQPPKHLNGRAKTYLLCQFRPAFPQYMGCLQTFKSLPNTRGLNSTNGQAIVD